MKITIHDFPETLEAAARNRAEAERKSVNKVLLDAVERGLSADSLPAKKRDLSFIGEGGPLEPEVLEALQAQRQIDPELWSDMPASKIYYRDLSDVAGKKLMGPEVFEALEAQRNIDPELWN